MKSILRIPLLKHWCLIGFATLGLAAMASGGIDLEKGFQHPPDSARPWVYWFWLNGNITSNGVTADLEAMKRVGVGGVLIMEVNQGAPAGKADFGGPVWRDLFKHVCAEAHRLGLEVNMNNDAGWCGSGGPWITPEMAMQKIVWTETNVTGPAHFEAKLARPPAVSNYYGDITVFAVPNIPDGARIDAISAKAAFQPEKLAVQSDFPTAPAEKVIPQTGVLELTKQMSTDGTLQCDLPAGNWTILRMGHTPTGKDNHPAPEPGRGLESDKLSRAATDLMFNSLMGKLIKDSKPLAGKSLVATHIDSWETGSQNWTPTFREDFKKLRGYDPFPFLPVITGRVIGSVEISERFLWDLRQTVSDLLMQNYAGRFRELAHKHGLRLSIEAYDRPPCDEMTFAGQADEPMSEFWSVGYNAAYSCTEMASAAHTYGKKILGAEAFTATDREKWLLHPAAIKSLGDWAFCEGINRFVFHRYALQPWDHAEPGMSMGPWGLHYERTQTWWEESKAWHEYLSRCQYLLQQGLFVADLCYLQPEGSPQRFTLTRPGFESNTPERPPFNFDGCTPEVLLTRMSVKDGRLVLPDGMSYRLLVLPDVRSMSPTLLRRVRELVRAGATVVGTPPNKSPSLSNYPKCDAEVVKLATELWGPEPEPASYTERGFGKGRVIFGKSFHAEPLEGQDTAKAVRRARWVWFDEGDPAKAAPVGVRYFRRVFTIGKTRQLRSARLVLTADNSFTVWVNGHQVGTGDSFQELYTFDVKPYLKGGTNIIAVAAENGSDKPNPAGLLAALFGEFSQGADLDLRSDRKWESAQTVGEKWQTGSTVAGNWKPVVEMGPFSMAPWNIGSAANRGLYEYPPLTQVTNVLGKMGVPPDFDSGGKFRYIHKRIENCEYYFVANPSTNWIAAECAFRVSGKQPELWNPMTGEAKNAAVFKQHDGRTFIPVQLEPSGSMFVVFRNARSKAFDQLVMVRRDGSAILPEEGAPVITPPDVELIANGAKMEALVWQNGKYETLSSDNHAQPFTVADLPAPAELSGEWQVKFQPNRGAPETATFSQLLDWSRHSDPGIKYFSGRAAYSKKFSASAAFLAKNKRVFLDLGEVQVMAQVKLNGRDLGILWKAPYRVEVTEALKAGDNALEVSVVNLWPNRMIGDEQLAEDSSRNDNGTLKEWPSWVNEGKSSPTHRVTFTSWRLWKKDSPLLPSGLLGPVRLVAGEKVSLPPAQALSRR